jgi:glycosyltransferase involved in cell wall biosynthesis
MRLSGKSEVMRFNQLNSCLSFGDAITHHTFEIDKILRTWGFETKIFAGSIDKNFASYPGNIENDSRYKKYMNNTEDILLFHYSVHCDNISFYKGTKNKKIFEYHNITPPEYFRGYENFTELLCLNGRKELSNLSDCDWAVGDSEYNRRELIEHNFDESKTDVLPIFISFEKFDEAGINENLVKQYHDGWVNLIFVGRIAPNKKIEDIIKCFYYYHNGINKRSRLFLIGSLFLDKYNKELNDLINQLNLKRNVIFTDKVCLSDLKTYYSLSDVFICMSEHEGFCVPLLECMYFKIPILAYNSTAIPFTLDKSGVLINTKNYNEIAELIHIVVSDSKIRDQIIKKETERLKDFDIDKSKIKLKQIIERVI